jgi:glucosylceramidase
MRTDSFFRWGAAALLTLTLLPGHGQARKGAANASAKAAAGVACWITTPDQAQLLQLQPGKLAFAAKAAAGPVIEVDDSQRFQTMDGFGYCLTGGSAELLHAMSQAQRSALLRELFGTDAKGIGVSYLRLSIGAGFLPQQRSGKGGWV